jgi:hypothetical protein
LLAVLSSKNESWSYLIFGEKTKQVMQLRQFANKNVAQSGK